MLKSHIDSLEATILAQSRIPANAGHMNNRGTPREIFIREFLQDHLSEKVALGTGEIIDANSQPRAPRNQIDIVIYKREYPKLHLGGGVHAFLAESVVATIEVKSILTKAELETSIRSASNTKRLNRSLTTSFSAGYQPPSILTYVVAYDGPASMSTTYGWLPSIHSATGITLPALPQQNRERVASNSIDGVFVLGKGFLQFDNAPMGFVSDQIRQQNPAIAWAHADMNAGSLLYLFLQLTNAVSGVNGSWLNPFPYLTNFSVPNLRVGP